MKSCTMFTVISDVKLLKTEPRSSNIIPKFVLIFSVREKYSYRTDFWRKLSQLIQSPQVSHFYVVDKTTDGKAISFFSKEIAKDKLTCITGTEDHSIFTSQCDISIASDEWIGQIHDDDDFEGAIEYFHRAPLNSAFVPIFRTQNGGTYRVLSSTEEQNPALALFSFLPAFVWNTFVEYIKAQKKNSSPALDVALNHVSSRVTEKITLTNYQYSYNSQNWANKRVRRRSVEKYMKKEGWGKCSGLTMAQFASQIDKLVFSLYFHEVNADLPITFFLKNPICDFRPSERHLLRVRVYLKTLSLLTSLLRPFRNLVTMKPLVDELASLLDVFQIIYLAYSSPDSHKIAFQLRRLAKLNMLSEVKYRLEFWSDQLYSLEKYTNESDIRNA